MGDGAAAGIAGGDWPAPFPVARAARTMDIIDNLPLGIAVLDDRGACYRTNPTFTETVGRDCTIGDGILGMAVAADRPALARAIAETLAWTHERIECPLRLIARPDQPSLVTVVRAPPGWGFGALLAVRDIREQIRLERQVAMATKMQAVGQLAGGVAHDFNNILTAVLGLCQQLLDRHPAGSADHDDLEQIRQNAGRAAELVGQLLAFSRQQTLRPQLIAVADVVAGVTPLLRQMIGPDVELVVETARDGSVVLADRGQLERVLTNLAVNARDAMAGRGRLTIAARTVAARDVAALGHSVMPAIDLVARTVSDTGSGIPPEIAGKIFEPFFTTKPLGQGTGLGLSTVYGIVKQTGGFVFAEPAPGGGTCFAVYLPASGPAAAPAPIPQPDTRPALGGTVLLVEDERSVRMIVERVLRRAGLDVLSASDGTAALELLAESRVDLLVSDVVMPGIDGVELLERSRERRPGLPVVLMSGYAEPPQRRALDGTGAVFLAKPFAADDLLAAVRSALAAHVLDSSAHGRIDTPRSTRSDAP
ncbi:MAG: response regulator [Sphingomonadaceae bacterium]|nr:response regulator [Sphingomonadaceae bacterium]